MRRKIFTTTEEITRKFIEDGWGANISFSELTLEEAEEKGYLFAVNGIKNGRKYFRMNICNNVYDDTGKLMCYDLRKAKY